MPRTDYIFSPVSPGESFLSNQVLFLWSVTKRIAATMGASVVCVCLLLCLALGLTGTSETGPTGRTVPSAETRPTSGTGETDDNRITVQTEEASSHKSAETEGVGGGSGDVSGVAGETTGPTGGGESVAAGITGPAAAFSGRLLVIPMDGSHWVGLKAIAEEMGRRGHQVTVVMPEVSMRMGAGEHFTTVPFSVPYGQAEIDGLLETHAEALRQSTKPLMERIAFRLSSGQKVISFILTAAESLLFNDTVISHLAQQGFDAVLTDPMVPTGSLIARHLGLPSVCLLRGIPCGLDLSSAACPSPPSYVPRYFTKYTDSMSFTERVVNFLVSALEPLLCRLIFWNFDQLANRFLGEDVGVADVLADSAIWLLRYDFTLEFPRPLMPNMVLVGGINCNLRNPLPEDLESWVSSEQHGFIVFTLGSMVSALPEEMTAVFLAAFQQIPQKVLWRYTGPVPHNIPENVKMMKWLPQNDLLAHPGARAFLTHGGSHGLYEGVCHGVPMVMLPLHGDQADNVHRLATRGVGVVLDIGRITVPTLLQALDDVINTTRYKDNVVKLSALHKDRPVDPLNLSVYWTEFVMRHKGAAHLRAAAQDLSWFQYHSLDVISLLLVLALAVVAVTARCSVLCVRRFRKRKQD